MYFSSATRTTSEIVSSRRSATALADRQSSSLIRIARGVVPLLIFFRLALRWVYVVAVVVLFELIRAI